MTGGVYKARERIHRGMLTSNSDFTEAGCSLRSELGPALRDSLDLAVSQPVVPAIVARVQPRA